MQRFAPSLIILLAALIYAATVVWQHNQALSAISAPTASVLQQPLPLAQVMAVTSIIPRPPQAVCDAIPHYTPAISLPLYGAIVSVDGSSLQVKDQKGIHLVTVTPHTRIIALSMGKPKPSDVMNQQIKDFNQLLRACQVDGRVDQAPYSEEETKFSATDLKPSYGVEIFMDETVDNGKTTAANITVFMPPKN